MPGRSDTFMVDDLSVIRINDAQDAAITNQVKAVSKEHWRRYFGNAAMQCPGDVRLGDIALSSRADCHQIRLATIEGDVAEKLGLRPEAVLVTVSLH